MMKITCSFAAVSGPGVNDYHWLAYRYDAEHGFDPERCESVIGIRDDDFYGDVSSLPGWITGLWRSEHRLWAAHTSGFVYTMDSVTRDVSPWTRHRLDASISGIWGLHDDLVFAWGVRGTDPVLFRFDGSSWGEIPSPGFVTAIHGPSEALLYLVGLRGLIARWNGRTFDPVFSPTERNIIGLFVESEAEMFACPREPYFLSGSVHGWEEIATGVEACSCITKWNGDVWVGNKDAGLFKWKDEKLELAREEVKAIAFDGRRDFLMCTEDDIFSTDGANLFRFPAEWVNDILKGHPLPEGDV